MTNREQLISGVLERTVSLHRAMVMCDVRKDEPGKPTRAQVRLMFMLEQASGLGVKELARRFSMTPSAVTQLVDGLVKKQLLLRKPDPDDRRKYRLALTAKGRVFLKKMYKHRLAQFSKRLESVTDDELRQLHVIQEKIIASCTNV